MTQDPLWNLGDVHNGWVLTKDGWRPLAGEAPPPRRTAVSQNRSTTPSGYKAAFLRRWRFNAIFLVPIFAILPVVGYPASGLPGPGLADILVGALIGGLVFAPAIAAFEAIYKRHRQ